MIGAIYCLREARGAPAFYVGRTMSFSLTRLSDILSRRHYQHVVAGRRGPNGKRPIIEPVELWDFEFVLADFKQLEYRWIRIFLDYGHKLQNQLLVGEEVTEPAPCLFDQYEADYEKARAYDLAREQELFNPKSPPSPQCAATLPVASEPVKRLSIFDKE